MSLSFGNEASLRRDELAFSVIYITLFRYQKSGKPRKIKNSKKNSKTFLFRYLQSSFRMQPKEMKP